MAVTPRKVKVPGVSMEDKSNKTNSVDLQDVVDTIESATVKSEKGQKIKEHMSRWFSTIGAGFVGFRDAYKAQVLQNRLDDSKSLLAENGYEIVEKGTIQNIIDNLNSDSKLKKTDLIANIENAKSSLSNAFSNSVNSTTAPVLESAKELKDETIASKLSFKDTVKSKAKSIFVQPFINMYAAAQAKKEAAKIAEYRTYLESKGFSIDNSKNETEVVAETASDLDNTTKQEDTINDAIQALETASDSANNKPSDVKTNCLNASLNGISTTLSNYSQMLSEQAQMNPDKVDYQAFINSIDNLATSLKKQVEDMQNSLDSMKPKTTEIEVTDSKITDSSSKKKSSKTRVNKSNVVNFENKTKANDKRQISRELPDIPADTKAEIEALFDNSL